MRCHKCVAAALAFGSLFAFSTTSDAALITYDFGGTLTVVTDPNGVLASNNPSLAVGSPFNLDFTFDYDLPPTFTHEYGPGPYGPTGNSTSWWGTGHSSMILTVGGLSWRTVGPERVDVVYQNPPVNVGLPQAIGSDHQSGAMLTNVDPGFAVVGAFYHLNWSVNNSSGIVDPNLTGDNFPLSIEVDPGNGTVGLIGKKAVPLLNGADDDAEDETED